MQLVRSRYERRTESSQKFCGYGHVKSRLCEPCLHLAVVIFVARRKKRSTPVEV